jgi:hypothetical protein
MKTSEVFNRYKDLPIGGVVKVDDLYTVNISGHYFKITEITKYNLGSVKLRYTIQLPNGKFLHNTLATHHMRSHIMSIQEIRKKKMSDFLK